MRVLYIGTSQTYQLYKKGLVPSHWLYGAVDMELDGYEVVWRNESTSLFMDLNLIKECKPNVVFIPNLNIRNHLLILFLSVIRFVKIPIVAYLHHEPKVIKKKTISYWLYRFLLMGCKHLFFLSEMTMKNTINAGFVSADKCSVPGWGPDMDFYNKVKTSDKGYYVSTGKENRDFDILIEAFKRTGTPLKIMTAKSHAGNNHEYLIEACNDIPNIEVIITENTGDVFPQMLEAMANAKALVCPLKKDKLNYCVGLSTIADAEGLHKPLIITRNSYHSPERMRNFNLVESVDDWVEAINHIQQKENNQRTLYVSSMKECWMNMKKYL